MPKIITAKRLEGETDRARDYVKTHILFPSGILGLILMVSSLASLGYQFLAETYDGQTFLQSSVLLVLGAMLGWSQTRYHRFLLLNHPEHFAGRMRLYSKGKKGRSKRETPAPALEHQGRALVPVAYVLGVLFLVGASSLATLGGHLSAMPAYLLPWAGFFWAKLFFWRGLLREHRAGRR